MSITTVHAIATKAQNFSSKISKHCLPNTIQQETTKSALQSFNTNAEAVHDHPIAQTSWAQNSHIHGPTPNRITAIKPSCSIKKA